MGNSNYPLGSKPNPISWPSYINDVNFHNWVHPAWVGTDANEKFLADSEGQEVNCTGSYNSPYAYTMYQQLSAAGCWSGGWVNNNSVISYISSSGTNYPPIDDNIFGNEDYPIPENIYEEMCDNEIWEGGWVIDNNNIVDYIDEGVTPNNGGSGSGSGSGSDEGNESGSGNEGSGSGSGTLEGLPLTAGSEIFMFTEGNTTFRLQLSWSSGIFSALAPQPSVNCTDESDIMSPNDPGGNMVVSWYAPYIIKISGVFDISNYTFTQFYNVPNRYRS